MGFNPRRGTGKRQSYLFQAVDFGDSVDVTEVISVPNGKFGRVAGAHVFNVTETFVGTTTGGAVLVGDGSDANLYYDSGTSLLSGSAPAVGGADWLPDTVASIEIPSSEDALTITLQACVGGTVTGICDVQVEIDWYDSAGYAGKSVAG